MEFKYQPIQLSEPRKTELPHQPISIRGRRRPTLEELYSILERKLLGIRGDFRVYESTYQTPITTNYQENNVGRVRHYMASKDAAVIVLPQRGGGYNFAQLIASFLAANGISAYEVETPFHGSRRIGTLR